MSIFRYKCSLVHILNWFKSAGCRTHLERVRGAILQFRNPQQAVGVSEANEEDDVDDDDDRNQSGDSRKGAKRAPEKPTVAAVAADAPARLGAPTTLRLTSRESSAAAAEGEDEEEGRGRKKQKKRKETSDDE